MKLYSHQVSPFARLCEIVAGILKQDIEVQMIDLMAGEQKQDWFLKINPKHQVPALAIDDKTFISESVVICQYLCKVAGQNSLYPDDPLKQARIDEAIADVKNMKFMYFAYVKIFGRPESAEGLKEAEDSFQALSDLRFKNGNTYLVGDSLTLADLVLAVNITMVTTIGQYDMGAKFPNLVKGFNEIEKLPEWQSVNNRMIEYIKAMMAKKAAVNK